MFFSFSRRKFCCMVFVCVFLALSFAVFAGAGTDRPVNSEKKSIVASTSWVAAIAEAAGAENVRILAPVELRHPPEYELRPSDLVLVSGADYVLFAGWERFAQKLTETAGAKAALIQVRTDNDPVVLLEEAERLSILFGTEENFRRWRYEFENTIREIKSNVLGAYADRRVVVQRMQLPFIKWLGLDVVGEYGPAEPSPALIIELARLAPKIVIDNYHGPSGIPISAAARVPYAELINFPGRDGTRTLIDVFRYNEKILIDAAR